MSGCPCEQEVQKPDYSPDVVKDNETIGYVVLDPDHSKDGVLTNAAFSHSRLKQGDLSISRIQYTSADQVRQNIIDPQIKRNLERRFVGIFIVKCTKLRSMKAAYPKDSRAICVIDDGTANDNAHAVLSYATHAEEQNYWSRNDRYTVRANLIDTFQKNGLLSLEKAFSL